MPSFPLRAHVRRYLQYKTRQPADSRPLSPVKAVIHKHSVIAAGFVVYTLDWCLNTNPRHVVPFGQPPYAALRSSIVSVSLLYADLDAEPIKQSRSQAGSDITRGACPGTRKDGATSYQWAFKICSGSARDWVLHNHKPAVQCHSSSDSRCRYGPPDLPAYQKTSAVAIYILTLMLERTVLRNFVPAAFPSSSSASEPSCACTEYKCLCVVSYITNGTGRMEGDQTRDV